MNKLSSPGEESKGHYLESETSQISPSPIQNQDLETVRSYMQKTGCIREEKKAEIKHV